MDKTNTSTPCSKCSASCCRYVAIEIGKPNTKTNIDHIRWYLSHKDVNIFIDHDNKWYIEFRTPCENISDDNKCSIYKSRPKICSAHGTGETECEYFDTPYKKYFTNSKKFEKYLSAKKIDWKFKT